MKSKEIEEFKSPNGSYERFLEVRETKKREVEKLVGQDWDPFRPFPDYCVINKKYTDKLHDFIWQDSKDFWGNTWTVKTCQRKGCSFKTQGYSQYVPGSIPNEMNIKLNAWDMVKVKQALDSITDNQEQVSLIKQIFNDNKDCGEKF